MMLYGPLGMVGGGAIGLLIATAVLVVPFWIILPRHGIPSWAAIAAIFPLFAVLLLWLIAFRVKMAGNGDQS